jgi:hypothetical protein
MRIEARGEDKFYFIFSFRHDIQHTSASAGAFLAWLGR